MFRIDSDFFDWVWFVVIFYFWQQDGWATGLRRQDECRCRCWNKQLWNNEAGRRFRWCHGFVENQVAGWACGWFAVGGVRCDDDDSGYNTADPRSAEKGGKRRTRTTNPTTTTERVPNKEQINKQVDAKFSMPYRPFLASKQPSVRVHWWNA